MNRFTYGGFPSSYLLLILLMLIIGLKAQAQTRIWNVKTDFAAVGDGIQNDHQAFRTAAEAINAYALSAPGASMQLVIPAGVYKVGRQVPNSPEGFYLDGEDVMSFANVQNLQIVGEGQANTVLRFADGLKYGSFDPKTHKPLGRISPDRAHGAEVGIAIILLNCTNVLVKDLRLDGNIANAAVGDPWGDAGIQLQYDGIFVTKQSKQIKVENVSSDHFGRDGIQVLNNVQSTNVNLMANIQLLNSKFDYNVRQGFSLTGVNGLTATNCTFNHTGRVINIATGTTVPSNPGCGLDVEPEGDFVANVTFSACEFINNQAFGVGAVAQNDSVTTENIRFENCTLWGVRSGIGQQQAGAVFRAGFMFYRCKIYGLFAGGYSAHNLTEGTFFEECTFEDKKYNASDVDILEHLFISPATSRYLRIHNSEFITRYNTLHYYVQPKNPADPTTLPVFYNCRFLYDNQVNAGLYSQNDLRGARFTGVVMAQDLPTRTNFFRTEHSYTNRLTVARNAVVKMWAKGVKHKMAGIDFTIGDANTGPEVTAFELGEGNTMYIEGHSAGASRMYIGQNAYFRVKSGAALAIRAGTIVEIEGQLIVEPGAYICIDPSVQITLINNGSVHIDPQASLGVPPANSPVAFNDYTYNCTNTFSFCVQGGHPGIISNCPQARGAAPNAASLAKKETAAYAAYPNPVDKILHLSGGVEEVELYNSAGKRIHVPARWLSEGLDVQSLPSGLYMLRVRTGGRIRTERIQVQH